VTTCTKTTIIEKISQKNNQLPSQAKDTVGTLPKDFKSLILDISDEIN